MAHPKGPVLLREWLEKHGISRASAAEALGVSAMTITDWLRRRKTPREAYRQAIEKWTSGAIQAVEWESARERRIADVRPFAPAVSDEKPAAEGA